MDNHRTQIEEYMLVYSVAIALGKTPEQSRLLATTHVEYLENSAVPCTWELNAHQGA